MPPARAIRACVHHARYFIAHYALPIVFFFSGRHAAFIAFAFILMPDFVMFHAAAAALFRHAMLPLSIAADAAITMLILFSPAPCLRCRHYGAADLYIFFFFFRVSLSPPC